MAVEFTCPCGQRFVIPETGFPRTVNCHVCGRRTVLETAVQLPLHVEGNEPAGATRPPPVENSGFETFVLTVSQVVTSLASLLTPFYAAWQIAGLLRLGYPWLALLAAVGGFVGFCLNAALFIVLTRVKRLGSR
jgi:hypothetical protein